MDEIWKPNDCAKLKLKVKKRSSLSGRTLKGKVEGKPMSPLSNIVNGRPKKYAGSTKRKNPFQCDKKQEKRAKYEEGSLENKENEFSHFRVLKDKKSCVVHGEVFNNESIVNEKKYENNDGKARLPKNEMGFSHQSSREGFPTDWSLKTKIRFKSDKDFSWCANLKSNHSSKGTVKFVRCIDEPVFAASESMDKSSALKINFRKNLSYWKHPDIPCIPSFPCPEKENQPSFTNICKDSVMRERIMETWAESFQSAFTLAKCGLCPYFYVCCQKLSCLFIGANVLCDGMIAVMTPTTKGLRELLQREGIEFEMPHLVKGEERSANTESHTSETDKGSDETEEDFLSSIGLNTKQFSSIKKQKFAEEISKLNSVDNRAQSTVFIKDYHMNALFNFLVNSDVIAAQSGAWQGVPPTLLSPVAFQGASLHTLNCVQGPMKFPYKGGMKEMNCLEISGPILPVQFYSLCQLLQETNESFEATIYSSTHSNAFNCEPMKNCSQLQENSHDGLGISKESLDYLRKTSGVSIDALAQIQLTGGVFKWKTHSF